jgi:hypothetical protein
MVVGNLDAGTQTECMGRVYGYYRLGDRAGYVSAKNLQPVERAITTGAEFDREIVTQVKPIRNSKLQVSDELKILDPALKRLVFAAGVFFFEGQSDFRVIEALKHVASGANWEIVTMHGAGEVPKVVKIVDALNIPYGIVVDYDQVHDEN